MIYVDKQAEEKRFVDLLDATRVGISQCFSKKVPQLNGVEFEGVVYDQMLVSARKTEFDGHIKQTGKQTFPDIVAKKLYGVEVKMTTADKWLSTGNSVLEGTRVKDVEKIYMFFGKFGGKFDAKFKKYQDCLYDVGVTHSPRYKIDMNLGAGESIFDKISVPYDSFRKEKNPIHRLKSYYKDQLAPGEELWWIDSSDDSPVSPVIKPFRMLDEATRHQFMIECMVFFPQIFGSRREKYERAAAYLITKYGAYSASLRDIFTAGGKEEIVIDGHSTETEQVLFKLYKFAPEIKKFFKSAPPEELAYFWTGDGAPSLKAWERLLGGYSELAPLVFKAGCKSS